MSGGCDGRAIARPRGATPCLRSRAEAGKTPCPKGGGQEELPHVRGQGQRPRVPDCDGTGTAERSYPESEVRGGSQEEIPHAPSLRPGAAAWRSNPTPEDRGSGREEQLHVQGAMAARAQEGLEELSHVEGQEGRW